MAAYKFKVLKGGKVYGEATTRAEAEAVAKKIGGTVAEAVTAKAGNPRACNPRAAKPKTVQVIASHADIEKLAKKVLGEIKRQGYVEGPCCVMFCHQLATKAGLASELPNDVKYNPPHFFSSELKNNPDAVLAMLGNNKRSVAIFCYELAGLAFRWDYGFTFADVAEGRAMNPANPPLERSNAAALLDTVKPGKPQVIHGVKVSRVGSGYSIDRMVLSRELAIQRLEQGGKVGNPAMRLSEVPEVSIAAPEGTADGQRIAVAKFADPYVGNDFVNGLLFVVYDPQTLHVGGTQRIATAKGKDTADYDGMFPDVAGLLRSSHGKINATIVEAGKAANPKAKPAKVTYI